MSSSSATFRQRLVAESLRLEEDRLGRILDDPVADRLGRVSAGGFEQKLISRAHASEFGREAAKVVAVLGGMQQLALIGVLVFGALGGIVAALAVLGTEPTVNIGLALSALLGLQTLLLLLWVVLIIVARPTRTMQGGGWWGRGVLALAQRLLLWGKQHPSAPVVVAAAAGLLRRERLGVWLGSLLAHLAWAAFTLGALTTLLLVLSFRQYDFVWGTTLLDEQRFVALISVVGAPAQWLGWPVPDPELVQSSRMGTLDHQGRERWSSLLLSALLFFALLPRLLLAVLSAVQVYRAARRLRLDTGLPGYARLTERLDVGARRTGVIDPAPPGAEPLDPEVIPDRPDRVPGTAVVIGLELERDGLDWPPQLRGVHWIVLGRADDRGQRQDVLAALRARAEPRGVVIVLCSLARTPDRGSERFLAQVKAASQGPVWAVLDEEERLKARGGRLEQRVLQWHECAGRAGLDYVFPAEINEDSHPGTRELRSLLGY